MKKHSTTLLCITMLSLGIAIGTTLETWTLPTTDSANAAPGTDSLFSGRARSNPLSDGGQRLAEVARQVIPSVVHIQSSQQNDSGQTVEETGSGVIVTNPKVSGTFIITNWHVVDGASKRKIAIHLHDGRVLHPVRIWSDQATDIAVLKVNTTGLTPAEWGNSDKVEIGHMVLAMGSPFGLSQSMTFGILSAKGRRSLRLGKNSRVLNQDFLQTDAAINPGNSGGPLIDLQGRIIGINTAIASNSGGNDGIGFSIPSNLVQRIVNQLLVNGKVQRSYLGVKLNSDFNEETSRRLGIDRLRGAHVLEIYANTPAAEAGLQFDDVILEFNGRPVLDENHLINLVSLTPVGNKVRLTIIRKGRRRTITVNLADRADLVNRTAPTTRNE
ncbi:MAG: trypsin-like peptidase domain-containing protein [Planctomycetaceae bacterium]